MDGCNISSDPSWCWVARLDWILSGLMLRSFSLECTCSISCKGNRFHLMKNENNNCHFSNQKEAIRVTHFCIGLSSTRTMNSLLDGMFFNTSALSRLSKWGPSNSCRREICSSLPISANSSKKICKSLNLSEDRKFNKWNNSSKLFCRGVPVSKSLYPILYCCNMRKNCKGKKLEAY